MELRELYQLLNDAGKVELDIFEALFHKRDQTPSQKRYTKTILGNIEYFATENKSTKDWQRKILLNKKEIITTLMERLKK